MFTEFFRCYVSQYVLDICGYIDTDMSLEFPETDWSPFPLENRPQIAMLVYDMITQSTFLKDVLNQHTKWKLICYKNKTRRKSNVNLIRVLVRINSSVYVYEGITDKMTKK